MGEKYIGMPQFCNFFIRLRVFQNLKKIKLLFIYSNLNSVFCKYILPFCSLSFYLVYGTFWFCQVYVVFSLPCEGFGLMQKSFSVQQTHKDILLYFCLIIWYLLFTRSLLSLVSLYKELIYISVDHLFCFLFYYFVCFYLYCFLFSTF